MKAVMYEAFGERPTLVRLPDPSPEPHGVVVKVEATGVCRSDWHGWVGHDADIALPHVPGHELAGTVQAVGRDVTRWQVGDRVTVPFVGGCGSCPECHAGHQQVCHRQFQPGFTHWGSFAEYVSLHQADLNLVALPDAVGFVTAASLGCRFVTSFRAVVDQGRVAAGQWVAVHGCGGVGLAAIMIAHALGANVVAVDITDDKLALAKRLGAAATIDARSAASVPEALIDVTGGGAHVSLDALGHPDTCFNSVASLRRRGKHVQVGLMLGDRQHSPRADEPGRGVRARDPRQPRHAGASLRRDDAHDPLRQVETRAPRREGDQPRSVDRCADLHGRVPGHRHHGRHQLLRAGHTGTAASGWRSAATGPGAWAATSRLSARSTVTRTLPATM
jgi:alcohol dehydrogenase